MREGQETKICFGRYDDTFLNGSSLPDLDRVPSGKMHKDKFLLTAVDVT